METCKSSALSCNSAAATYLFDFFLKDAISVSLGLYPYPWLAVPCQEPQGADSIQSQHFRIGKFESFVREPLLGECRLADLLFGEFGHVLNQRSAILL